jgi:serine/threonine-protein kinase RsbW
MWLKASLFVKTIDAVTQTFDAAVNGLGAIREFVTEKALAVGADSRKNNSLCLAVDEIATNIICYGYPNAGISDNKMC